MLVICAVTSAMRRHATSTLPPASTSPTEAPPADPGVIPLTVAEVKRLFTPFTRTIHDLTHHLRWDWWRRRHQPAPAGTTAVPGPNVSPIHHDQAKCGCRTILCRFRVLYADTKLVRLDRVEPTKKAASYEISRYFGHVFVTDRAAQTATFHKAAIRIGKTTRSTEKREGNLASSWAMQVS
jgi:hypothetical protein